MEAVQPSPWRSVWLSPRDTIERVVATDPRRHVLLLIVLAYASWFAAEVIDAGLASTLRDWRTIAAIVLLAAILGPVSLYLTAFFLRWVARMFGGRASMAQTRAVIPE